MPGVQYVAFVDPSDGSQDAMTLAIAHNENGRVVLDALRERRPPFSPEDAVQEFAHLLKHYGITAVTGDRYGGKWPRERFREHGIAYEVSQRSKSELYSALLPAINSDRIELLDLPRLVAQLSGLERRTSRGGRDTIDHGPGGSDDVINAAAGALVACATVTTRPFFVCQDRIAAIVRPGREHPFSHEETNLRDRCTILRDRLDLGVEAPRGCHLTLAPGGEAAALAVGYVKGLVNVKRTSIGLVEGATTDDKEDRGSQAERLPIIVLEALLRIVPEKDDEIVLDEVIELVLRLRDEAGLQIQWVTADSFRWTGPLQALQRRGCQTGELSEDDLRPYNALKSSIYDARLETYHYPPLLEQLAALRQDDEACRVKRPTLGLGCSGREVADAAAGVVHLLVRRRSSWAEAAGERPSLGPRVSLPRPTFDGKPPDEPTARQPGRIPVSREEWVLW